MIVKDTLLTGRELAALVPAIKYLKPRPGDEVDSIGMRLEDNASRLGEHPALLFEGRTISWGELNALSNRYANCLATMGVRHGDSVSLFMENRIEFVACMVAIQKLGAIAGLINTKLQGRQLAHCISVTESSKCIFGAELSESLAEVVGELPLTQGKQGDYLCVADAAVTKTPRWALSLDQASAGSSCENPASTHDVTLGDRALYIFTSGTTGLPKAAVMTHKRYLATATGSWKATLNLAETDRIYLCLPLYHGTALFIGFGGALCSGCSVFLRRSFSTSHFLPEVRKYQTNCLVYIGELCRYLLNLPERADDADNPITRMTGNGLRPDVWMQFKQRFGIERIAEFYGSSEGNVAFANVLNKDCTIGFTMQKIALVAYDVDADEIVRNRHGRCKQVRRGEPGLLLARIDDDTPFEGYTNAQETEKKIVRNVFAKGDAWFNSGDLIRRIDVGFAFGIPHYQFVDRVGDTYRWKSENVSTNEVGEIINDFAQVKFCNVYGVEVPGADGRAGMAAITLADHESSLDLKKFSAYVMAQLPVFARPVFVRVQPDLEVTGTFKMLKGELRKQAYDVEQITDPLYVMKPKGAVYEPLTADLYQRIIGGKAGF